MFCSEYLDLVHGGAKSRALGSNKHVLKYVRGIVECGLRYLGDGEVKLQGYTSSYWVDIVVDKKSNSRCCFSLGSVMISWFGRKQTSVALTSVEAEYMAANTDSCEAIWLRKLLVGLFD